MNQMNKLMIFPLAMMFLISVVIFMANAVAPTGNSPDSSSGDTIYINDTDTEKAGRIDIPTANSQTIDMWGTTGLMAVMLIAIGIGIVAGVHIIGSGFSDTSQRMIFSAFFFIGLWIALTVVSSTLMLDNIFTQMIWIGITLMYFVGLGTFLTGGDSGD